MPPSSHNSGVDRLANIGRAKGERMAAKLRATVVGQTDDPEHLLDVLIAAWDEMHRERTDYRGAVDALREIAEQDAMTGVNGKPWRHWRIIAAEALNRLGER